MTTYRVGEEQILLLMLKLDETRFQHVLGYLDRILLTTQQPQTVRCPKILNALGKYDLAIPLEGENLAILSRAAYNLLAVLEKELPGSVVDFLKIPAFRWGGFSLTPSPPNSVALVQIKLKRPLQAFANKRTVLKALAALSSDFTFDLWGGLSWHEIIVDLAGPNFHTVPEFFVALFQDKYVRRNVSEYSSIPVWNPRARYQHFEFRLQQLLKATDYDKSLQNLDSDDALEARLGFIDLASTSTVHSIEDLEAKLQLYEEGAPLVGRKKYSSVLLFTPRMIWEERRKASLKPSDDSGAPALLDKKQAEALRQGFGVKLDNIVKEKLEALIIQLKILRNDARFKYLIPPSLLKSLESLEVEKESYPEEDIQGYIVTLQHVFQQRLAGTYPASSTGIITGYADGFGGFQRIILAAETLLSRSMRMMLPNIVKKQKVLVLFDHLGVHEADLSIYEEVRRLSKQAPIIVRLTGLKYEPWSWHRGIRDIALWCREIERMLKRDLQVFHRHQPPHSPAFYACRVLRKQLFKQLFAFESRHPLAEKAADGTYAVDESRLAHFAAEMESAEDLRVDEGYDPARVEEYSEEIKAGAVFADELKDDQAFRCYTNAYFALPLAERRRPRAANSFVLSLYNSSRHSLGE
jgi:hypothetical protein